MGACILASCPLTSANHGSVAPIVTLIWRPYLAETRGAQCGAHCGASIQVPRGAHHLSKDARRVSHERLGRAKLDQPAGSEHEHLIRVEDRVEPVRNREHGHGGEFGAHRALEEGLRRSVERQGNQSQSESIGGNRRPSEAIRPSVAISGHQWPSVAISGHQWPSVVALTWMRASVSESTEEVASSMITIAGRVSSARAMHNSWRCPADKFAPSSSTCSSSV